MGWFSILPERFNYIEKGISAVFIFLGVVTIGPWLLVFVYDFFLYLWRALTHDIPVIGGRAQGKQRPRAPSLAQRPNGHRRRFSLAALSVDLKKFTIPENEEYNDGGSDERNDSLVGSPQESEYRQRRKLVKRASEDQVIVED